MGNKHYIQSLEEIPRKPGDVDLVGLVKVMLDVRIGDYASKMFYDAMKAENILTANSVVQRILINKYLTNVLLTFKNVTNKPISELLPYLINDGASTDWSNLLEKVIMPYFIQEDVMRVVANIS